MSFFTNEAYRLLRESWPNPTMLAEELYAIFDSDSADSDGQQNISQQNPLSPAMTFTVPGNQDSQVIAFQNPDGDLLGTIGIQDGDLALTNSNGQPITTSGGEGETNALNTPQTQVSTLLGIIQSGSGGSYSVLTFLPGSAVVINPATGFSFPSPPIGEGIKAGTQVVTATLLVANPDPNSQIPEGTWVTVYGIPASYSGNLAGPMNYYILPPMWM